MAAMTTGADTEATQENDEGHDEGGPGDVESPAGHGGARHRDPLSTVQLREVM